MGSEPGARGRRRLLLGAAGVGCTLGLRGLAAAAAPFAQPAASAGGATPLDSELVRTGLYLIRGGGGNSLLRLSANGMLLVDGKSPGNHRALMTQVRRISRLSDMPIRALVLTDHHEEHSGDSAEFMAARVAIVAQRSALGRLSLRETAGSAEASPVTAFDDQRTLKLGGVELQLKHFGPGCTDGDTVAYFPDMKIVALGDLFTPGPPTPDVAAGGSLVGWAAVLAQVLELDVERVVPGDGPVVGRGVLVAYKEKVDAAVSRARALVAGGVGKDRLMAQWRTDDLGWRFDFSGLALDRFYAELAR